MASTIPWELQLDIARTANERAYWAFLSYSHADARVASWLFRRLESFVVPRALVGRETNSGPIPRRLAPIFRDRDDLEAAPRLGQRICAALDRSRSLIVICSPNSAASPWVNDEIAYFLSLNDPERIFCVLVNGDSPTATAGEQATLEYFPLALRGAPDPLRSGLSRSLQPVAADLRPHGDGRRLALLKLVAGMLGIGLDELVHRDARRRQRQLLALVAVSVVGMFLMAGLTGVALAARDEARRSRDEARHQQAEAEGLIEFMLGDLRKTLEPVGKLDALGAVGQRALKYYSAQAPRRLDADSLGRRARVLHLVGDVNDRRGDLGAALTVFQEGAKSTAELVARQPNDAQRIFDHAQSVYWVGYIAYRRGQTEQATKQFQEYMHLADRLIAIDPNNDEWQAEVGYANSNLGTVLLESGQPEQADAAFKRLLVTEQHLSARKPNDRTHLVGLAQAYGWNADTQVLLGALDSAMQYRLAERNIYSALLARQPADLSTTQKLMVNRQGAANILIQQRRVPDALRELRLAAVDADRLLGMDSGNTDYRQQAASLYTKLGQAQMLSGLIEDARASADKAVDLAESLVQKDASVVDWSGRILGGARMLGFRVRAASAGTKSAFADAIEPSVHEFSRLSGLSLSRPRDLALARTTAEAAILAGDYAALGGDEDKARATWSAGVQILDRAGAGEQTHALDRARMLLDLLQDRLARPVDHIPRHNDVFRTRYSW